MYHGSEISAFCNRSNTIFRRGDLLQINSDNINTGDGEFNSLSSFFKNREVLSFGEVASQNTLFSHWMIKEIMEQTRLFKELLIMVLGFHLKKLN